MGATASAPLLGNLPPSGRTQLHAPLNPLPMIDSLAPALLRKLRQLQAELADLAFTLDQRGRAEAADLAVSVGERVGALCDEFAPPTLDAVAHATAQSPSHSSHPASALLRVSAT
jgi:hypothetical protein